MSDPTIEEFSRQLRARLRQSGIRSERAVTEAVDHLLEARSRAMLDGLSPEAAAERALSRFGSAETVASAFQAERSEGSQWLQRRLPICPEEVMTRPLMLAFSVATTLLALFIGLHTLIDGEGHLWMIVLKLVSSAAVVWVGILSWMTGFWERFRPAEGLLLGAVLLVALGAAGVVWVFYLAETTGDLEAWAIPVNLLLVAQGVVTVLYLWRSAAGRA